MTSISIIHHGCAAAQAESEIMAGLLNRAGYLIINETEKADVIIIYGCFVKAPTEEKIIYKIKNLQEKFPKKKIVIAGCIVDGDYSRIEHVAPSSSMVGTHYITKIVEVVDKALQNKKLIFRGKRDEVKLNIPRVRINKKIAIIPISCGCLSNCAYCCTRIAKGTLFSYPPESIVQEVKSSVKEGCDKVYITAQDTGAYGLDIGTDLPKLLTELVKLPGDFKIRVGMMNPDFALKFLDRLIEVYKNPKIIKFAHIPVQAGSSAVLKKMRRNYSAADFRKIVKKLRKEIPGIRISTDIICGFPGESEKDFEETMRLVQWLKPEAINISKFYPRPGTEAKKMKQLPNSIIKNRSRKLSALMAQIRKV